MNAGQAANLVAQFVDAVYPNDKEKIFGLIRLGINRAWKEGKWFGMTAEIFVPVQQDANGTKFIISPFNYSNMLGVNVNCEPRTFRSIHFMFHKNGYGDIKQNAGCDWNEDVYDEGVQSCLFDFKQEFPDGAMLGIRSLSDAGSDEKVWIQGVDTDSEYISTFEHNLSTVPSGCNCIEVDGASLPRTVHGIELTPTRDFQYINNIIFSDITKITKSITQGVIEVVAIDKATGRGKKVNSLFPWEYESSIKRYRVPKTCCGTVHGLFKIDPQPILTDESQPIIISDDEAIISLAMGVYSIYHKQDIQTGTVYIQQGINALEKEKREKESPDVFPLQLIGMTSDDTPEILKEL